MTAIIKSSWDGMTAEEQWAEVCELAAKCSAYEFALHALGGRSNITYAPPYTPPLLDEKTKNEINRAIVETSGKVVS